MANGLTVGIDMAAAERETAICRIRWGDDGAVVAPVETPADDDAVLAALREAEDVGGRAGVDCPFGWPEAFVDAVTAHRDGRPWPHGGEDDEDGGRDAMRLRVTDRLVRDEARARNDAYDRDDPRRVRVTPLSVSTDRLGVVALRWARLAAAHGSVDRTGAGALGEVYPAAALHRWQLLRKEVRDSLPDIAGPARTQVLDDVTGALPALRIPDDVRETLAADGHAFDAFVAALVARAAMLPGGVDGPATDEQRHHAPTEGWILQPALAVGDLLGGTAPGPVPARSP